MSLFSGAVNFDADGKAKIDLPLPGFDGTLRLMAIAASSQRFGSAEQEMKVASPVVASLAAPRFLAVGDSGFLTVDINNTTTETQTVTLKIDANPLLAGLALNANLPWRRASVKPCAYRWRHSSHWGWRRLTSN